MLYVTALAVEYKGVATLDRTPTLVGSEGLAWRWVFHVQKIGAKFHPGYTV